MNLAAHRLLGIQAIAHQSVVAIMSPQGALAWDGPLFDLVEGTEDFKAA